MKNAKNVTLRLILAMTGLNTLLQTFVVTFSHLVEGLLTQNNDVELAQRETPFLAKKSLGN